MSASSSALSASCIFCKIIRGEIPSRKLAETAHSFAFLDVGPLSNGHCLVIPKYHAVKAHELPDEHLADILPMVKKLALATGAEDYNILNNNGRIAHQVVDHVHFHVIPKPSASDDAGLGIKWPTTSPTADELDAVFSEMKAKLESL